MTYSIHLYDRAGEYLSETVATFHEAIKVVEKFTRQYPTKVLAGFNDDQVDAGFDGLTDDERDAIDRAVNEVGESLIDAEGPEREGRSCPGCGGPGPDGCYCWERNAGLP